MATQTGSIDLKATGGFKTYADAQFATSEQVTTLNTAIQQNASDILFRATKTEAAQMAQPNLAPLGSVDFSNLYKATTNPDGYWRSTPSSWFTQLEDGWVHCYNDNTSGAAATNTTSWRPSPSPSVEAGKVYTILTEIRNNNSSGSSQTDMYLQQIANNQFWGDINGATIDDDYVTTTTNISLRTCGETYVRYSYRIADTEHLTTDPVELFRYNFRLPAGSKFDFDFRQSVYEGIYDGPYKPYVGSQLYASQAELKVTNDEISSKVSKDGVISSINQSAETVKIQASKVEIDGAAIFSDSDFRSAADNAYASKTEFDSLEIGGRNLLLWTGQDESYNAHTDVDRRWMFYSIYGPTVVDGNTVTFTKSSSGLTNNTSGIRVSAMLASGAAATTADSASLSFGLDLKAGDTLTFSCDVKTTGNRVAIHAQYYNGSSRWTSAGSITEYGAPADTDWHRYSHTFTVASNYVSLTALGIYCELTDGVTISARNFKLERGNKATDWSPAPEDMAVTVGGRNLLQDSKFTTSFGTNNAGWWVRDGLSATLSDNKLVIDGSVAATGNKRVYQSTVRFSHVKDVTYTFSCDIVATAACQVSFGRRYGTTNEYGVTFDVTTTSQRLSGTYTATKTGAFCISAVSNSATVTISNPKLEIGNKATDWSPAPEDVAASAVKRTQRIWYRKSAEGAPATPGTASSNWVVKADDGSNAWTKMHVAITETEKFIYTCEQHEMGDGTVGYTSVLLDNTITVIDGGSIITNSITANQIAAGTITSEEIAGGTITSDNIAAGAISADRLDANALTLGNIEGLEDRLDAIDSGLSSISTETQWVHYDPDRGTVFGENGSANNLLVTGDGIDFNTDEGRAAWATGGVFHANEMEAETVEAQIIVMGNWALVQSGTSFYIDYIG